MLLFCGNKRLLNEQCFLLSFVWGFFLCTSQDVFPLSAVSGEVVLQQFSVLPSDFPPVTG